METVHVSCAICGRGIVEDVDNVDRKPCANCGSISRKYSMNFEDHVNAYDLMRAKSKRQNLRSKDKLRSDVISGYELQRQTGKFLHKERVIDKDKDYYFESITDPETGLLIHECEEKLSMHQGHGSAKPKSEN